MNQRAALRGACHAAVVLACASTLRTSAVEAQDPIALSSRAVQHSNAGRKQAALALLDSVSGAPGGLDPAFHRAFFRYHADSAFLRIVARIRRANPPIVRSTIAFTVAERDLHPEGIAFDPVHRAILVGSFKGKIIRIDSAGHASDFASLSRPEAPRVVVGVRVDASRGHVWAAVDDPRAFGDATIGGAALVQLDLETGRGSRVTTERTVRSTMSPWRPTDRRMRRTRPMAPSGG